MGNYKIFKITNDKYKYLVIATAYISPLSALSEIEFDLNDKSCTILFDLTLINGTNSNRYLLASIKKGTIDRDSFTILKDIDANTKQISIDFFKDNADIVEHAPIPKALKYLLVNCDSI